jgi:hypothetical protein
MWGEDCVGGASVVDTSVGGVGEGRGSQNVRDTACSEC